MYGRTNTPPTYDEANSQILANQPVPPGNPPPSGYWPPPNSAMASWQVPPGLTRNRGFQSNNNLSTVENNICGFSHSGGSQSHELTSLSMIAPPPYTPIQLSSQMPPSIYGDNIDDPTYKEMIVIIGGCGGGKSHFINQMLGGDIAPVGDGSTRCKNFTRYLLLFKFTQTEA